MKARLRQLLARIEPSDVVAVLVSLASGVISWDAEISIAAAAHVRPELRAAFPAGIDGLLLQGMLVAHDLRAARRRQRAYVWALIGYATLCTLGSNALHATSDAAGAVVLPFPPWGAFAASAVPALAWAATVHLWVVRKRALDHARSGATASARAPRQPKRAKVRAAPRVQQRVADLVGRGMGVPEIARAIRRTDHFTTQLIEQLAAAGPPLVASPRGK